MSTSAASGDISDANKKWGYDEALGNLAKAFNKLTEQWDKGSKVKLEEGKKEEESKHEEEGKKKEDEDEELYEAARQILRRKIAQRRTALLNASTKVEEDEVQRAKLEELKSKISEVKKRVEEAKRLREEAAKKMEASATGTAQVGAVKEETPKTGAAAVPNVGSTSGAALPAYWTELLGASRKYQKDGLLSSS